jgi:peptidoglycan DL-endopeptidase LytF
MSRKNTILIAVIINMGLLSALFFTASRQKEKSLPIDPSGFLVENEIVENQLKNKSENEIDEKVEKDNKVPIVHVLPEIVKEKDEIKISSSENKIQKNIEEVLEEVIVKKGDNLEKIAKTYNISADDIVEENQLKTTIIRIGQMLKIPKKTKTTRIKEQTIIGEYYEVKPGDNPWTIAMKHNIRVDDLLKLNNLNKEKAKKLKPGDKLRIR